MAADIREAMAWLAGRQFARIPPRECHLSLVFIKSYAKILQEQEVDGLLVEAFNDSRYTYDVYCVTARSIS